MKVTEKKKKRERQLQGNVIIARIGWVQEVVAPLL